MKIRLQGVVMFRFNKYGLKDEDTKGDDWVKELDLFDMMDED